MIFKLLKFLLRVVLAVVIFVIFGTLFQAVLPTYAAYIIAAALCLAELLAPMFGGQGGLSLRLVAKMTLPLLAWVIVAWGLRLTPYSGHYSDLAIGAIAAACTGMLAARHGSGHEHARLAELVVATAIPVVAMLECLLSGDRLATVLACVAVAAGMLSARMAHVWPDGHEAALEAACAIAMIAAAVTGLPMFF